jgi:hypothetical protein
MPPVFLPIFLFVLFLLTGCNSGWGPPRDVSRFEHATVAADGRLGVFTYKQRIYRPASGWRAFPDGGPSKDVVNENGIAIYDPQSGEVRVLWRQDVKKSRWLPEASCSVTAAAGRRALAVCGGQQRSDYMTDVERFWLDLDSGATEPLPLEAELAARSREFGELHLLDPDGTLALVVPFPEHPEGSRKLEPVRELLLRLSAGEYLRVGEIIHYYGFRAGEIHFWSADHRHLVYQLASRTVRPGAYREYLALSEANLAGPTASFTATYVDGGWRLQWGRRTGGEWHYETLPLSVAEVAGR